LITGATGLLGSHIAEQLRRANVPVRAVCRPGSDTTFLESIGVEIVPGDITDPDSLRRAAEGMHTVYHAAARVGDWGPWAEFVALSIDGTQHMLEAAVEAGVKRLVHISSISVYGHRDGEGLILEEDAPLGVDTPKWSYYSRAKVAAERIVWRAHEEGRIPVTVIRPSWLYGQRDRATLPRLIGKIRRRKVKLIGDGENRVNVVHAANVAEGTILAAQSEKAIGQAYNICHDGVLTQRKYFNMVAEALGERPIKRSVPYAVAHWAAFVMECFARLFGGSPLVTRYTVWLIGRRCFFECHKIKKELGWQSRIGYAEGIPEAVEDYRQRFDRHDSAAVPGRAKAEAAV